MYHIDQKSLSDFGKTESVRRQAESEMKDHIRKYEPKVREILRQNQDAVDSNEVCVRMFKAKYGNHANGATIRRVRRDLVNTKKEFSMTYLSHVRKNAQEKACREVFS